MRVFFFFIGILTCLPVGARAQTGTINGRITDTSTGTPLPGATVAIVGTTLGAAAGDDGAFAITEVPAGVYTLRASLVGYTPVEREIAVRSDETIEIDFTLAQTTAEMDEVTITGDAEAAEIRESPYAVTVIDGQRLAGRGLTLDEALQRATGVQIRRTGGLGSASIFNIRGLEGQRVQIYIDGNPADVGGDSFTLDNIPLQLIERVEVYKGVVPARFGGDGLGAAVNVVIIKPEDGYFDAGYTLGSYGQHQFSVTGVRPLARGVRLGASVNVDRAENDYAFESPFLPGLVVRRDHDAFRRILTGAVLETSRLWFDEVEVEAAVIASNHEIQGIQTNVQHAESHALTGVAVLGAERLGALGGRLDVTLGAVLYGTRSGLTDTSAVRYSFDGAPFPSPNGHGELGLIPTDSDNRLLLLRQRGAFTYRFAPVVGSVPVHTANLTYVLDAARFRPSDPVANAAAGRNVSEFPGDQMSAVVGLSHEWRPFGERFVNVVGARGYAFRSEGTPSNLTDPTAERPPPVRNATVTVGASEAVRYRLRGGLLAKASVELARRLPTNTELFGDGLLVAASPAVRPERSLNINVGLQLDRTLSDRRRVQAEVSGFVLNLRDMIRLTQGYAGLAAYTNLGAVRIAGAEAEVRADLTGWLHGAASLTYQDARDVLATTPGTTVPSPTYELRLPNLPWLFGSARVEAHVANWLGRQTRSRLFAEGFYTEEYFYAFEVSSRQERRIPRTRTLGLGLEQAWLQTGLTLAAEVQNVTDARVLNVFNQPLPGRVFRLKLRYTLVGPN